MFGRLSRLKSVVLGLLLAVTLTSLVGLTVLYLAISPRLTAQHRLYQLAKTYAKLTDIRDFAVFNGTSTYYSIIGKDDRHQEIVVLLSETADQPQLINVSEKVSKSDLLDLLKAKSLPAEQIAFGIHQDRLVWEVTSQDKYYLFDAETGDLLTVWG